ncbi:uncharacterized protein LOC143669077 [Tamandua tetradactyla]|uniref:uncharacterized protein LOC143669077 n=1 Tax=Tamandua tetradactyla TaxID=48850 RepID=UPI0040548AEA
MEGTKESRAGTESVVSEAAVLRHHWELQKYSTSNCEAPLGQVHSGAPCHPTGKQGRKDTVCFSSEEANRDTGAITFMFRYPTADLARYANVPRNDHDDEYATT